MYMHADVTAWFYHAKYTSHIKVGVITNNRCIIIGQNTSSIILFIRYTFRPDLNGTPVYLASVDLFMDALYSEYLHEYFNQICISSVIITFNNINVHGTNICEII